MPITQTKLLFTGLAEGTTAVAAGSGTGSGDEFDNIHYDAVTNPLDGKTQAEIHALVGNAANWVGDNSTPVMIAGRFNPSLFRQIFRN